MLPGPVFLAELRSTSRRARYYAARSMVVGVLLFVFIVLFGSQVPQSGVWDVPTLASLGAALFSTLRVCQMVGVMAMTPAIVAGTIAEEKARKTLGDILASDLSSAEIVVGKLFARMLHVFGFVVVALPVLSLATLLGGVDPGGIVTLLVVTVAIAFFLGGMSILVSTISNRPRDAVVLAYGLTIAWLVIPYFLEVSLKGEWPKLYDAIAPVSRALAIANPFLNRDPRRLSAMLTLLGLVFVTLATFLLRPMFRKEARVWRSRPRAFLNRKKPPCGDDPILWKERFTSRRKGWMGLVWNFSIGLAMLTILVNAVSLAWPIVRAFSMGTSAISSQREMNDFLRVIVTMMYVVAVMSATATAAVSIRAEIESDTWVSLIATPLDGPEILAAKRKGAMKRVRPIVGLMVVLILVGAATGSVHFLGAMFACVILWVGLQFAVALGVMASLLCKTTTQAMAASFAVLFFCQIGFLFCCASGGFFHPVSTFASTPFLIFGSLISYEDVHRFQVLPHDMLAERAGGYLFAAILSPICYYVLAIGLAAFAESCFDQAVGRPLRPLGRNSHDAP